uniref:Velvet domain-containing protein n=1 Tax=Kwoniella pini CBS 10737 TaxID=1296096 RepID=A0A1B9HWX7_9TREE|nr:uncharacterized protein I206_06680 [Kwoniella pini CBS 10737]OCF47773.1 hypothetical protein I206_06680 [Kwoniella pini CBS 10737]
MCSTVPFCLPTPPPGYRLIYVPPHDAPGSIQPRSSPHRFALSDTPNSSAGSSTPAHMNPPMPQLPTPSDTPMSPRSHRGDQFATDHDCVLRKYEMKMRQQPVQARMCGVGEKSDRRPIDPTPIIQLKVIDENVGLTLKSVDPYYFLFACLVGGDENEDELHVIDDGKTRFLTGTPVSSLYHLKDLDNTDAAFFVFPDLGVRKEGRYKLKLTLFEIVDQEVYYCTTMFTSTFSVYSAKKFPGMSKATDLSKSFAEQGLKIRVRKDPRQPAGRATKTKRKSDAAESEEEFDNVHHDQRRQHPPPQHHHQAKRSRGASLGYPNEEAGGGRYYRPTSSHSHAEPPLGDHRQQYSAQMSNGHPNSGYHPNYPPPGHHMPPPPPPSAYDPYRGHQALTPHYPPPHGSYAPQYYESNSGRPATHPAPGSAGPSHTRPHQSLPPPGYGPPEHPNFHHHQQYHQHSGYHHQVPPSAYHQRGPPYPDSPYSDQERERERNPRNSVPWPQDAKDIYIEDRERERHRERQREVEFAYARDREIERERERERERYSSSRGPPQLQLQTQGQRPRTREGPRPLSPRSRVSPSGPGYNAHSVHPSPTLSPGLMHNQRPVSSSNRERERNLPSPGMTLPPLSLATSTPPTSASRSSRHSIPMQQGSAGKRESSSRPTSAGLPPIVTDRERERDDTLSQRSGSARGSKNASPTGDNTPVSARTGRMSLHNIVD